MPPNTYPGSSDAFLHGEAARYLAMAADMVSVAVARDVEIATLKAEVEQLRAEMAAMKSPPAVDLQAAE